MAGPTPGWASTSPAGEVGGTAPSGYTTYLNAAFTLLFLGQVYVGYVSDTGKGAVGEGDGEGHSH
jgi:hypothetical protein